MYEFLPVFLSLILALGGIKVLISSFDDDDDEDGGGMGSPVYEPALAGSAAWLSLDFYK